MKTDKTFGRKELAVTTEKRIGDHQSGPLAQAMERIAQLHRKEADLALSTFRRTGEMGSLLQLLIDEREACSDQLTQRNREIGALAFIMGKTEIALAAFNQVLSRSPGDLAALNCRGHVYRVRGEMKEAEDDYSQVLELGTEGNDQAVACSLGHLGLVHHARGDLSKAEDMHTRALEIERRLGRAEGMANQYSNLGGVYQARDDLLKAEAMHTQALTIYQTLGRMQAVAKEHNNLGHVYYLRQDWDQAEAMLIQALEISKTLGQVEDMAHQHCDLALVCEGRGDLNRARACAQKSLKLFRKAGVHDIVEEIQDWLKAHSP
jgi:tetratricopeptide (TPR) repeat protein